MAYSAKLHTKGIHPPATLNQEIEHQLLSTERHQHIVPHDFDGSYRFDSRLRMLFDKNDKIELYSIYRNLVAFYSKNLFDLRSLLGVKKLSDFRITDLSSTAAIIIYRQRKDPTLYQRIAILDGVVTLIRKDVYNHDELIEQWSTICSKVSDDNPLKQQLNRVFELGYVTRYYEIVNPENIYVKATMMNLEPTPGNFEMISESKISDYGQIIEQLRNGITTSDIILHNLRFKDNILIIEGEQPENINRTSHRHSFVTKDYNVSRYGWSKVHLSDAIKRFSHPSSGWSKNEIYIPTYRISQLVEKSLTSTDIKRLRLIRQRMIQLYTDLRQIDDYDYENISDMLNNFDEITQHLPKLTITRDDLIFYQDNKWKLNPLVGFQLRAYMSRFYYETIYRHFYQTVQFINWPLVCSRNLISEDIIRNIAWYDYNIDESLSMKSLCIILSATKSPLSIKIKTELLDNVEPIKMQPGSLLVDRERRSQNLFEPQQRAEFIEIAYQKIYNICSTIEDQNMEDVVQLIIELGIIDDKDLSCKLINKTKQQICLVIINYLNLYRQSKQLI